MQEIPEEVKEALNNPDIIESIALLPGSKRFKAMALGFAAFNSLKEEEPPSKTPLGK